jgi:uncharacterized protein (DUF362 family)
LSATVSVVKCEGYQEDLVLAKIKETVDLLGGMEKFVSPGQKILLKPNLLSGRPIEKCVTTHPLVVKAIALLVREAGAVPLIGDGPQGESAQKAASKCGIEAIAKDLNIGIVEFEPIVVQNPNGKIFKNFVIGKILKEVDGVINIPKLKTHGLTTLTVAVKNIFGCIPGFRKAEWHLRTYREGNEYFAQMLLDLYDLIDPVLNIVDGVIAMEGKGPGFGDPRNLGLLIGGTDAVAVDRIVAEIVNIPAEKIPTLQMAMSDGFGTSKIEEINVVGEEVETCRVLDFKPPQEDPFQKLPKKVVRFLKTYLTFHPTIILEVCEVCKSCLKACPRKCISVENGQVKINRQDCIQCYCCMEACPHAAIDLKPGSLLKAYQKIRGVFRERQKSSLQS